MRKSPMKMVCILMSSASRLCSLGPSRPRSLNHLELMTWDLWEGPYACVRRSALSKARLPFTRLGFVTLAFVAGCVGRSSGGSSGSMTGGGGAVASGGTSAGSGHLGGPSGGIIGTGGNAGTGGASASGGTTGNGGATSTDGASASGGTQFTGGAIGSGGAKPTGGALSTGGGTGGAKGTGGAPTAVDGGAAGLPYKGVANCTCAERTSLKVCQRAMANPRLCAALTRPLLKARKRRSPSNTPRNMRLASLADAKWIAS